MASGTWTDPERGKIKLGDYAATWITNSSGLRPRTVHLYSMATEEDIEAVHRRRAGRQVVDLSRAARWVMLLGNGVSAPTAAKAYTHCFGHHDDRGRRRQHARPNPCRIRAPATSTPRNGRSPSVSLRPGRRVGHRQSATSARRQTASLRFSRDAVMRTSPERFATGRQPSGAVEVADEGRADCPHDRRFRALVLLDRVH